MQSRACIVVSTQRKYARLRGRLYISVGLHEEAPGVMITNKIFGERAVL